MAVHTGKLTKRAVDAWKYSPADPILWDGQMPNFGVKANPSGSKSYLINYQNKYNVRRRYTIGKHGGKLTCDQARKTADELLRDIRVKGADPLEEKRITRAAESVNDLLDRYLASAKFAELADTTQYTDRGRIKRHLRPTLGDLKLEQVTPDRVRRAFADIRDGKTAVNKKSDRPRGKINVRGGDGAARMAIRVLRAIFNWAIREGLMTSNPAEKIEIGTDGTRDAILENPEQYTALFKALDKLETERQIPEAAADAIRVLAFTGARRNEIAAMKWEHVDLERGIVELPPKSHKTGRRTGKHREIALNSASRAILASRPQGKPQDFVFPPSHGEGPITLSSSLWALIRKEAGLPDGITNHSLRHSLGTLMAMQGAEAAEIMATLGHTQLSTAQRYIHIAKDARTSLAEKYTAGIMAAATSAPKAEVVELPAKRKAK